MEEKLKNVSIALLIISKSMAMLFQNNLEIYFFMSFSITNWSCLASRKV